MRTRARYTKFELIFAKYRQREPIGDIFSLRFLPIFSNDYILRLTQIDHRSFRTQEPNNGSRPNLSMLEEAKNGSVKGKMSRLPLRRLYHFNSAPPVSTTLTRETSLHRVFSEFASLDMIRFRF